MKALIAVLCLGLVVAMNSEAGAATEKRAKSTKSSVKAKNGVSKKQKPQSDVHTSHNFEDHGVTGEYQMPDEALAKVENEKSLSDLLGVRKHFKDRLAEASEQE